MLNEVNNGNAIKNGDISFNCDNRNDNEKETLKLDNDYKLTQEEKKLRKIEKQRILLAYTVIFFIFLVIIGAFFLLLHIYNNSPHLIVDDRNIIKPLNDQNSYRIIKLKNGIHAILISSKDEKKSHFSLTIPTGSFDDGEDYGLAHLTEHVFFYFRNFLNYLKKNDGLMESNTKDDKTSFYYEIINEHFPISLLNIKKFLQSPDFTNYTRIKNEIENINSEYENSKSNSIILQYQILKTISNPKNSFHNFNLGNKNTFYGILENKINIKLLDKNNLEKYFTSDGSLQEHIFKNNSYTNKKKRNKNKIKTREKFNFLENFQRKSKENRTHLLNQYNINAKFQFLSTMIQKNHSINSNSSIFISNTTFLNFPNNNKTTNSKIKKIPQKIYSNQNLNFKNFNSNNHENSSINFNEKENLNSDISIHYNESIIFHNKSKNKINDHDFQNNTLENMTFVNLINYLKNTSKDIKILKTHISSGENKTKHQQQKFDENSTKHYQNQVDNPTHLTHPEFEDKVNKTIYNNTKISKKYNHQNNSLKDNDNKTYVDFEIITHNSSGYITFHHVGIHNHTVNIEKNLTELNSTNVKKSNIKESKLIKNLFNLNFTFTNQTIKIKSEKLYDYKNINKNQINGNSSINSSRSKNPIRPKFNFTDFKNHLNILNKNKYKEDNSNENYSSNSSNLLNKPNRTKKFLKKININNKTIKNNSIIEESIKNIIINTKPIEGEKIKLGKNVFNTNIYINIAKKMEKFFFKNYKVNDVVIIAKSNLPLDELSGLINDAFNDLNWEKVNDDYYFPSIEKFFSIEEKNEDMITKSSSNLNNQLEVFDHSVDEFKINDLNINSNETDLNSTNLLLKNKNKFNISEYINNELKAQIYYPFDINNLGKLIIYKRENDDRPAILDYFFPIDILDNINDKPYEILSYLLKFEEENSLIQRLKSSNIITNLNADLLKINKKYSLYVISLELVKCDDRLIPVVHNYIFQYINLVKKCFLNEGYNSNDLVEDLKKILKINFELMDFSDDSEQVEQIFLRIYDNFQKYKVTDMLYGEYNATDTNLESFNRFLKFIDIKNTIVMYGTKNNFYELKYLKYLFNGNEVEYHMENFYNNRFLSGAIKNPYISIGEIFYPVKELNIYDNYNYNPDNVIKVNTTIIDNYGNLHSQKFDKEIEIEFTKIFPNNTINYFSKTNYGSDESFIQSLNLFNIFNCKNIRKKNNFITNIIDYNRFNRKQIKYQNTTNSNSESMIKKEKKNSESIKAEGELEEENNKNITKQNDNLNNNPVVIIDQSNLRIYYMEENGSKSNQINLAIEFIFFQSRATPYDMVMLNVYYEYIKKLFSINLFEAKITGNKYELELTESGILVKLTVFEDILSRITNIVVKTIKFDDQMVKIDSNDFKKMYNKSQNRLKKYLKNTPASENLENEIFRKIVKYNFTNKFEMIDQKNNIDLDYFRKNIEKLLNTTAVKSIIIGSFQRDSNLDDYIDIITNFLFNTSFIDDKDEFNLITMDRILDDSYIFRKVIPYDYLKENSILNVYQYGEFDEKTYIWFRLLEVILNSQFTKNELMMPNIDKIKSFEQGLLVTDGHILHYKFFVETQDLKEFNVILNDSLLKFKNDFNYMTNFNLLEFKNILQNQMKDERSRYRNISSKSNKLWQNLEMKSIDVSDYLSSVSITDIRKLYDRLFFGSKVLSIQVNSTMDSNYQENTVGKNIGTEEEVNKEINLVMKVKNEFDFFEKIKTFYQEPKLFFNSTSINNSNDDD